MSEELKPCPFCKDIWLYVSDGDYYSGYESFGYRVSCRCGFAWKAITWQKTKEEAIKAWNKRHIESMQHAHWIEKSYFPDGTPAFICSRCGRAEPNKEPYCNCGAKMDEKENDK